MQRSFDDLGTPLREVTFCVVDLETTGGSPADSAITEIGAVKLRGGECLGTFQTLVNPGVAIPPPIVVLTGITDSMVFPAPRIEPVLPTFLEFLGDSVVVGHNVGFDLRFLQAALEQSGRPRLPNRWLDTCSLARRLLAEEVPNCRLATLADRLRLAHQPCHRALDDALATGDLLHTLLERAGSLGVLGLDDLLALPTVAGHPQAAKLRLVSRLPRKPGVYLFRGRGGRVLYVGKATNLRARVRSYFSGDERRKVGQLLRETEAIDHVVCAGPLEASVLEVRLIHRHLPPFNRRSKRWRSYAYVKLTLSERFPRLSLVRTAKPGDGCLYLGPLGSLQSARAVAEAIESAVPIRRCTLRPTREPRPWACTPAQLGVATCPCAGSISEADYAELVDTVVAGLTTDPATLLDPLESRMWSLAAAGRFEEAADTRDRAGALSAALQRQRRLDGLRRAGRVAFEVPSTDRPSGPRRRVVLDRGRLVADPSDAQTDAFALHDPGSPEPDGPVPRELVDELLCVAAWLDRPPAGAALVECDGNLAVPWPRPPGFQPTERPGAGRPPARSHSRSAAASSSFLAVSVAAGWSTRLTTTETIVDPRWIKPDSPDT